MEPQPNHSPLVVIVGQTASGKSALALDLAERWNGEIIAADSRTVYRGMDIGTAKPTASERARVPHHLVDVFDPDEQCTASDFRRLANEAIADITGRGKVPFLVGGTGLYIDAVLFNFSFRGEPDLAQRQELEGLSVAQLQDRLHEQGIALPENARNPRHLIRAIETNGAGGVQNKLRGGTTVIGIDVEKEVLHQRIADRVDAMLTTGLKSEALALAARYGWDCPSMQTIGYQEFRLLAEGVATIQEVRQTIITHSQQYAKRQKTWFKRNKSIHWISKTEEAVEVVTTELNK